ncbi:MAG: hypothetical protein KDA44_14850, partial [Planctomycetales bacterium]|nr:hypothetical protein [Planctomycetales bacterium]
MSRYLSPATIRACILLTLLAPGATRLDAATRTWIGGNVDWVDGGSAANWSPADEPDSDDDAVFNTANSVSLGSDNVINGLTLSGNIDLFTQTHFLDVNGDITLSGAGTTLNVGGNNLAAPANGLDAENITINSGASMNVGGTRVDYVAAVGEGIFDINAGGTLYGNGTIDNNDGISTPTAVLINDGTISVGNYSTGIIIIGGTPTARTLAITAADVDARVDLDGTGGGGVVNVFRNQTLDIDVTLNDAFSGDMNLFQESTIDVADSWTLDSGSIDVDNGFVPGTTIPFQPAIPAGVAYIRGGTLVQTGGTINVIDSDGTLQFDASLNMNGGNLVNNGTVVFNALSTIQAGANFSMPTSASSITVSDGIEVNIDQPNFDADGTGSNTNVITIGAGAILDLDLGVGADEGLSGRINLNGGELDVTTNSGTWAIDGVGDVFVGANTGVSQINGDPVTFSGSTVVNVAGGSTLDVNAANTWNSGGSAVIAANGALQLDGTTTFNGGGGFTGGGTLRIGGSSTVAANTTIAVDTFDWDGLGVGSLQTIATGATLTIDSLNFDTDSDMDDPLNLGGGGSTLVVNGPAQWEMEGLLTANVAGAGVAEIAGTSRMILTDKNNNDPVDLAVTGTTAISAPVTFGQNTTTDIGTGSTLQVTSSNTQYDGAVITGLGTYIPGGSNVVQSDTNITSTVFDFDSGSWVIDPGATLAINVSDYDTVATNAMDSSVTINSGTVNTSTGDPEFVMDGQLNLNNTTGVEARWQGEPLDIGDDLNSLDSDLNVAGTGVSRILSTI